MAAVVEIENLQKRFGSVEAVSEVTLAIDEGEAFGYLGPNGAGKTTTIRCLLGLIKPSSGSVRLFGREVRDALPGVLADVGYLPGEFGLWPQMTGAAVLEHLGRLHRADPTARARLCDRFELARAQLDRQVRSYSRGMKQKIGIVQAFQHTPSLVVLDEPTEGLDPLMQERFVELLREHTARGGTVLLSSHILSAVELATDRVGIIKAGRLVKTGATGDVTGERARNCTLVLKQPTDPGLLDIDGVDNVQGGGTRFTFEFRGDMERLLKRVARAHPEELLVEPERLSDAFFDIYSEA